MRLSRFLVALVAIVLFSTACGSSADLRADAPANATDATSEDTSAAEPTATPTTTEPTESPTPEASDGSVEAADTAEIDEAQPAPDDATEPPPAPTLTPEPPSAFPIVLPAGQYCYQGSTDTSETHLRLTAADSGEVSGDSRIFIADEANAYFTSAFERFEGNFGADGSIEMRFTTWIEFDIQQRTEIWAAIEGGLEFDGGSLTQAPCDIVRDAFVDVFLPETDIGVTGDELLDRAFFIDERISFDPGASSATVSNAVVVGDAGRYLLEAGGGQLMSVSITSLESNAVYAVVAPSGLVLDIEQTSSEFFLPHSGDYAIVVSSARGNATYDLTIAIS